MKELSDLIRIVTKRRIRKVELISEASPNNVNSKVFELYQGIKQNTFTTNEIAAEELYGTDSKDKKYLMLKSRLKQKLIETILFLEFKQPEHSPLEEAKYNCDKNLFVAKTLVDRGASITGLKLLSEVLNTATKFQITSNKLESATLLAELSIRNKTKYTTDHYYRIAEEAFNSLSAERNSNEIVHFFDNKFIRTTTHKREISEQAKLKFEEIEKLKNEYDNFSIHLNYLRIKIYYYMILTDYKIVIKSCEEARRYFFQNTHLTNLALMAPFEGTKLQCLLMTRQYNKALSYKDDIVNFFVQGSLNWFLFSKMIYLLFIQTEKYREAEEVLFKIINHSNFTSLPEEIKEIWNIFASYQAFFEKGGYYISPEPDSSDFFNKLKVQKLLIEVPVFSKDKLGFNIAILIVQILHHLIDNNFEALILKKNSIDLYISRHLRNKGLERSYYFLKMIIVLIQKDFDVEKVRKFTRKYYKKLHPDHSESVNMENLEVIFYDSLWEIILNLLEKKQSEGLYIKV